MPHKEQSISRQSTTTLALGACLISFSAIFVKSIGQDIGPTAIGFWRVFLGAIFFAVLARLLRQSLRVPPRFLLIAATAGFFFAADIFCWHRCILYTGAGMATILGNTQVFPTAILSALFFKEVLTWRFFVVAFAAVIGVAILVGVFSTEVEFTSTYTLGIVLGLITGIAYAGYIASIKFARKSAAYPIHPAVLMTYASAFTAVLLGIVALFESAPVLPSQSHDWIFLIGLALIVQTFGWWAISSSLDVVEVHKASLILLLQPTLATVWGILVFNESFVPLQLFGAVLTLTAIYLGSIRAK